MGCVAAGCKVNHQHALGRDPRATHHNCDLDRLKRPSDQVRGRSRVLGKVGALSYRAALLSIARSSQRTSRESEMVMVR